MMNRDRGSSSAKVRKPRVKTSAISAKLDTPTQPPPLVRSHTLPFNNTLAPRAPRSSSLTLPDKEKARSDDGFHSDSDKDSNQSANSNISVHSNKSYLTKTPSIKSNVVAKVRPKSSLGTMSDNSLSDKSTFDIATLNRQLQADKQAEEARKNRKIEDLEISIKSLTRFNAELEAANKKQAAEIRELRKKLRINNSFNSIYGPDDDDDDDEVSTPLSEIDLAEIKKDNDARFRRICVVIDELIQDANEALAYTSKIGGSKVLTNAQLDSNNTGFQNSYMDESSKIPDNLVLSISPPPSKSSKVQRESESNSTEKSNTDTITNKTQSNLSVINERTFVNDPKIKLTTEIDNTNSTSVQLYDLSLDESVEEKNQRLQANLERARTVANELLSLEKQDNNMNNNIPHERKGLGLLLPIQNGHSPHVTHIGISDSPQPSPRMILLYELQESLGIGDAESLKYLKENRRSLPVMSSDKTHFNIVSPSEESQGGDSRSIRRRSSPNFRTLSYPPISNVSIRKTNHTTSLLVKKEDSVLNSLPHGSEKRSVWLYLTTPFRD